MMKRCQGILAVLIMLAVLGGVPVGLAVWGSYPDSGWMADGILLDGGMLLLSMITAIGWLAWAAFAVPVANEFLALFTHRRLRARLPFSTGYQRWVAGLVLGVVGLLGWHSTTTGESSQPGDALGGMPTVQVSTDSTRVPGAERAPAPPVTPQPVEPEVAAPAEPEPIGNPTSVTGIEHLVKRGDHLWHLAERYYGDGSQWRRILQANRGLISDPDLIRPGWKLLIPDVTPTGAAADLQAVSTSGDGAAQPVRRVAAVAVGDHNQTESFGTPVNYPDPAILNDLLGGTSGLLAAAIIGSMDQWRAARSQMRGLGQRPIGVSGPVRQLETALRIVQRPEPARLLDQSLRLISRHRHVHRLPLPRLNRIVVRSSDAAAALVTFYWDEDPGECPDGFSAAGLCWRFGSVAAAGLEHPEHPSPYPALVSVGTTRHGDVVLIDLETRRGLEVIAPTKEMLDDLLQTWQLELDVAPWVDHARVVRTGNGEPGLDVEAALYDLEQSVAQRRNSLSGRSLRQLRCDPNWAGRWTPIIYLLVGATAAQRVRALAQLGRGAAGSLGIAVGFAAEATGRVAAAAPDHGVHLTRHPAGTRAGDQRVRLEAELLPEHLMCIPHLLPGRSCDLVRRSISPASTEPFIEAPWWDEPAGPAVRRVWRPQLIHSSPEPTAPQTQSGECEVRSRLTVVAPDTQPPPTLMMLGGIELRFAAGRRPDRAVRQCEEYCGWLLEHPGCRAADMAAALIVAEGTRRSNVSRLRSWLGADQHGHPYLPDAYSGSLSLHPAVTSDWLQLQRICDAGVLTLSLTRLADCLALVRGAPLADATSGTWLWAASLRADMCAAIRDIAVMHARRCLAVHDIDQARWGLRQAVSAVGEDDLLLVTLIEVENQAGNHRESKRWIQVLVDGRHRAGLPLSDDHAIVCGELTHGRRFHVV